MSCLLSPPSTCCWEAASLACTTEHLSDHQQVDSNHCNRHQRICRRRCLPGTASWYDIPITWQFPSTWPLAHARSLLSILFYGLSMVFRCFSGQNGQLDLKAACWTNYGRPVWTRHLGFSWVPPLPLNGEPPLPKNKVGRYFYRQIHFKLTRLGRTWVCTLAYTSDLLRPKLASLGFKE